MEWSMIYIPSVPNWLHLFATESSDTVALVKETAMMLLYKWQLRQTIQRLLLDRLLLDM